MPRQERAERSRAAILEAAAAEFDAHGYAGARLDRIIERTQLTKGAVYFHFRSKRDLAEALVAERGTNWVDIVTEVEASGAVGLAAVREVTRRVARSYASDTGVRASLKLSRELSGPDADPVQSAVAIFERYLTAAAATGELPPDSRPLDLAMVVVQACTGALLIADARQRLGEVEDDISRIWMIVE